MRVKVDDVDFELQYLPILANAAKIQRRTTEIVKKLSVDLRALAELRMLKERLGKNSFQINSCQFSESKTASTKEFMYPKWLELLLNIAAWINKIAERYRKAHPEAVIIVKEGHPYVKVSAPKEVVEKVELKSFFREVVESES